jgi:hypothetical protein
MARPYVLLPLHRVVMLLARDGKMKRDVDFVYRNPETNQTIDETMYQLQTKHLLTLGRDGSVTITDKGRECLDTDLKKQEQETE